MIVKRIALKFAGTCRVCRGYLPMGARVYWQSSFGAWHLRHGRERQNAA